MISKYIIFHIFFLLGSYFRIAMFYRVLMTIYLAPINNLLPKSIASNSIISSLKKQIMINSIVWPKS